MSSSRSDLIIARILKFWFTICQKVSSVVSVLAILFLIIGCSFNIFFLNEDYFYLPQDPETSEKYDLNNLENLPGEITERRKRQVTNIKRNVNLIDSLTSTPEYFDGLLICTKFHPTSIALPLLHLLKPSRPFTIFCINKEPLMDAFIKIQELSLAIQLNLRDIFLREMQVLPNRTHPEMFMKGHRGFILTGIKVKSS